MKCPQCSTNHKKSEGMRCRCGYDFAFNPTEDEMTDGQFLAAIRRASANDTAYFTRNQLYTALCKFKKSGARALGCAVFLAILVFVFAQFLDPKVVWGVGVVLAIGGLLWVLFYRPDPPTERQFDSWLRKWDSRGRKIARLVRKPGLFSPPPEYSEPDVYDYGFEKLLVVDDRVLVDVLVLNGFHARERTLVVSGDGYPSYLRKKAIQVLEESPQLPVYFLHAATRDPVEKPKWLPEEARQRLVDLGLFPEDVKRMKKLRPLKPQRHDYQLPADMVPYGALAGLVGSALLGALTLSEVLAEQQKGSMDVMSFG